jgi:hypothetical protein
MTVSALGVDDISSSKVSEYREIPKGIAIPFVNLFATKGAFDVNLLGYNVRQKDQRYTGWMTTSFADVSFDYNQVPHNMGNAGRTIYSELGSGVWGINSSLRAALGASVNATPTAGRNVRFYDALLGPTFATVNSVDVSSLRKRGTVEATFGGNLPVNLVFTYTRDARDGYRGLSGGDILGAVSPVIELPEPLHDVTQDFGFRTAYTFARGNVHATLNRNLYNNKAETFVFDNPFQATDVAFTAAVGTTPAFGGPSRARFVNAPDNEATTVGAGFLLKFARQTRIGGDVALGRWTQNAAFYPYTINSAVRTTAGVQADSLQALQQASFDGKIDTTTMNVTFSSRPVKNLALRANFRSYDLANKTKRFVITGDMSGSPDRSWATVTATADAPYGHATANVYDSKVQRFTASASYDIGMLTVEGQARTATLDRTSREATSGKDTGAALSALLHASEWLGVRATFDSAKRTAEGETVYGFQADEAERKTKRMVVDIELTPIESVELLFAYQRRDVDFTNRPDRVQLTSGQPTPGAARIPNTASGLLEAKYDSYTAEVDVTPNGRVELGAYYTYEKDASTNQWATLTGAALNNLLNYRGTDETDTFGAHAVLQLVPEKWTCTLTASRQKTDGLMDITAREAGAFYTPGRTTLVSAGQGGAGDIADYDDTELTTVQAQLDYNVTKAWTFGLGYWYEKYDFKDAFTAGDLLMPQSVLIFMKPDDGAYKANIVYATLNYRF